MAGPIAWSSARRAGARAFGARAFASLATPNYRLFFFGQLISVCGTWMQTVAQSFLVLQLSGSGTTLGLTLGVRFLPLFLFGPWGGLIADRLEKRRVLLVTQAASGVLALAFGLLISTGRITLWMVFVLAGLLGVVNVFDNPARQSLVSDLVPRELLSNAVSLNSITVNISRIVGAAVGGAIASLLGLALCFDLNGASFCAVIVTLLLMKPDLMVRTERQPRERGQIRAGFRYARATPEILVPLLMVAVVGMLAWEFQVSLPLLASVTFGGGPGIYGWMWAAMSCGAIVGGLVAASHAPRGLRSLAVTAIGWGISITAAALAPTLAVEFVVLAFVGYGSITFNSMAKTVLQLLAKPSMRGRVMALWGVAWLGSTPIGGPIIGWIGEHLGARWSLLAGGLPTLVVGLAAFPVLSRLDRHRTGEHRDAFATQPRSVDPESPVTA